MKKVTPLLLYLIFSLVIFFPVITGNEIPAGGDWSLPTGEIQTNVHFQYFTNAWNDLASYGSRNVALSFSPVALIMRLLFSIGLNSDTYTKFVLPFIFTLAGFWMYSLLRHLKIKPIASFFGGLIYITSPLFFNYSIMGWVYILFFISALLPLSVKHFLISQDKKSVKHLIITAIIYAAASIQAQSVLIFPLVFFIIGLLNSKNITDIKFLFKSLSLILLIFLLLTAYWLPGMLLIPDQGVAGSNIVNSSVSLGTSGNLSPVNILRLFGGLYNFQFESIISRSRFLMAASFSLPLIAIASLLIKKYRKQTISFWCVGLIPLFMYFLNQNRSLFSLIPYSNVFRDFSRFTTLSTFAYTVSITIVIHYLIEKHYQIAKVTLLGFVIIWIATVSPWWTGEITNWQHGSGPDMRLRVYEPDNDYLSVEKYLATADQGYKALYIPTGGYISFPDNEMFFGAYHEMQDMYSQFSPIPGALVLNDRNVDDLFINKLKTNITSDLISILQPASYKYIIVRKNAFIPEKEKLISNLKTLTQKGQLKRTFESPTVSVYELTSLTSLINTKEEPSEKLTVTFQKINPSKYTVSINGAKNPFTLIFNEHFHQQWKIFPLTHNIFDVFFTTSVVEEGNHLLVNDFSNAWQIDPNKICQRKDVCNLDQIGKYQINLQIEFLPQRIFYCGIFISSLSLLFLLLVIIGVDRKKR